MASGLFALGVNGAPGAPIVLNKVGNDILGQVGAVTYFKISVDGNGVVTFTQSLNVWHADTTSDDDTSTLTLSDPALLQLTITDGDGDTNTAVANIGGSFQFEDDGPSISATGAIPPLAVDETVFATNASASFAAVFAPNFGNDGPKDADNNDVADADAITYALGMLSPSGLIDTLTNSAVNLSLNEAAGCRPRRGRQQPCVHDYGRRQLAL